MNGQTDLPAGRGHEPDQPVDPEDKTSPKVKLTQEEHHTGLIIIRNFLKNQSLSAAKTEASPSVPGQPGGESKHVDWAEPHQGPAGQ